jgi:hypothetical protein
MAGKHLIYVFLWYHRLLKAVYLHIYLYDNLSNTEADLPKHNYNSKHNYKYNNYIILLIVL